MKISGALSVLLSVSLFATSGFAAGYISGFETPTFTSGPINGQDSWTTASPGPAASARVLTATELQAELTAANLTPGATVHGGAQGLLISMQGSSPNTSAATIRVITGLDGESTAVLDVWARPLGPGGAGSTIGTMLGNVFVAMEDSNGDRAAAFRFGTQFGSTIDYGTAPASAPWQPSDVLWNADTWYHLTMNVDYSLKTYDFFIDGIKKNAAPIPFYSAASDNFHQLRLFRGNNQAGMIVDDLMVSIPEPTAAVCFLTGVIPLCTRRRHASQATEIDRLSHPECALLAEFDSSIAVPFCVSANGSLDTVLFKTGQHRSR